MIRKILISVVTFAAISIAKLDAQPFRYHAPLAPVDSSGFYAIPITPQLTSCMRPLLEDLRITDSKGQQVPYIIRSRNKPSFVTEYRKLKIYAQQRTDSSQVLLLENESTGKINNIGLLLKNASVSRVANISGSNNLTEWYTITENVALTKNYFSARDEYVESLGIPTSSYRYYRILINNGKNDALNILSAGYSTNNEVRPVNPWVSNGQSSFRIKDSTGNHTYIFISNPRSFHIGRVLLSVEWPKYFNRSAELSVENSDYGFSLSSTRETSLEIPLANAKTAIIKIYNGDNPPLQIRNIETFQPNRSVVAWLQKGEAYKLMMGADNITQPDYDLDNFADSISSALPITTHGETKEEIVTNNSSFWDNKTLIWIAMAIVLAVLLVLTFRLIREADKNND